MVKKKKKKKKRYSLTKRNDSPGLWSRFGGLFVKCPYVILSISTSHSPVMLRSKILMFLSL